MHAIISEWECPVSEEWIALTNLIELTQIVNHSGKGKKPKPPWRPWDKVEKRKSSTSVGSIAHLPESEKRKISEENKRFIELMRSGKLLQQEGLVIKELPSDLKF